MLRPPKLYVLLLTVLVLGLVLGWWSRGSQSEPAPTGSEVQAHDQGSTFTCSMHPQVRSEEPGPCPICGMDLIPLDEVAAEDTSRNPATVNLKPEEKERSRIQTVEVGKKTIRKKTDLQGKIALDERLEFTQSAHFPGRVESLFLDYEGAYVNAGDRVAEIYSPKLVQAQRELIEAYQVRERQPKLYQDVLQKFRNWMIPQRDLDPILQSKEVQEAFPVRAQKSGFVLERLLEQGGHVKDGGAIYRLAELSQLWVYLDLYRDDLAWIQEGDSAQVRVKAFPGLVLKGTIEWIAPRLDPQTRTTKARLSVPNPGGRLRPGMLVESQVSSSLAQGKKALVVPHSAVMWTGQQSLVFVEKNNSQGYQYQARKVSLGPNLGDSYLVEKGLQPGERIASQGAFTLDAAAQLAGKPSMMKPPHSSIQDSGHQDAHQKGKHSHDNHAQARDADSVLQLHFPEKWKNFILKYLRWQEALAADELKQSQKALAKLTQASISSWHETDSPHSQQWMQLEKALGKVQKPAQMSLKSQRQHLLELSQILNPLVREFQPAISGSLYVAHCPMAGTGGADWLTRKSEIQNPYYGAEMLRCGSLVDTLDTE